MVKKFDFAKLGAYSYIILLLLVMYAPILVLVVFSFTDSDVLGIWNGFTFDLYGDLFANEELMIAVGNTLILALVSSLVATLLGTLGAIGIHQWKKGPKKAVEGVNQIPVVTPEIVLALSLTIMFVFVGRYLLGKISFSFWTLLIGHLLLSTPFVYLNVKPKLEQMDPSLYEAALDLGCSPRQALIKVTIPEIAPGIFSGFLIAITLSLDDFIVTAFTSGPGLLSGEGKITTISTYVQGVIKKHPLPPELRALCALIFLAVLIVVITLVIANNRRAKKLGTDKKRRIR